MLKLNKKKSRFIGNLERALLVSLSGHYVFKLTAETPLLGQNREVGAVST